MEPITYEEKLEWVKGPGKDTYIASYATTFAGFCETSCLVTAAVIRYKLTGQIFWNEVFCSEDSENTKIKLEELPVFQVSFGRDGDYDDHVLVVVNGYTQKGIREGYIYQSCWTASVWDTRPFSVDALPHRELTPDELEKLTGFRFSSPLHYSISVPFVF